FRDPPAEVKGATRKGVEEFLRIVDSLTAMVESQPPSLVLQSLLDHTAFFGYRESGNDEDETRLENMNQLMESMEEYEEEHADGNLHDFLDEISLLSAEELAEGEEGVTLMTIHSAKGLEFDVVFLPGWEDGVFPMKRRDEEVNMEEERRLAYVSITRARKKVFISRARERGLYGPAFKMDASPFLHELPRDCLQFEGGDVPRERLTEISGDLFASIKGGNYHQSAPSSAPRAVSQTPRRPSPARESAAAPAASTSGLTAGVTVSHPKFGVGVIKAVVGEGKMEKAIVSFRNGETKVIVTSFLTPN
ncbi:ATP-dependent helicase, partial [Myxococcota bacterium]|nr:ATP-dependent helicase [Myxococcota bacterium]